MRRCLIPVVAALVGASAAQAQISNSPPSDLAGFRGLVLTPAGAFPQLLFPHMRADHPFRSLIAVRVGQYNYRQGDGMRHNIGVTGMYGITRRLHVGGTFGRHTGPTTSDHANMGSLDIDLNVFHKRPNEIDGADTDIGVLLSAGYGKPDSGNASARSIWMSVPLAITVPQHKSTLSLFIAPSFGRGVLEVDGVSDGSLRPMFGAGATWAFDMGLAAHVTLHRIVLADSPNQIGFGLSYTFGGGPPRSK
jgi:hypothetical protein